MKECCGNERSSTYCQECGKRLVNHDRESLRKFLQQQLNVELRQLQRLHSYETMPKDERPIRYNTDDRMERGIAKQEDKVEKWEDWIDMM